jgi:hypothetical protein
MSSTHYLGIGNVSIELARAAEGLIGGREKRNALSGILSMERMIAELKCIQLGTENERP